MYIYIHITYNGIWWVYNQWNDDDDDDDDDNDRGGGDGKGDVMLLMSEKSYRTSRAGTQWASVDFWLDSDGKWPIYRWFTY